MSWRKIMTVETEEPDKKEIMLKITQQTSGMKYKDKRYTYYRINSIPKELVENENYNKGYFEIEGSNMKMIVFDTPIVYSIERHRKASSIISEENFHQRREIKDWKERFEKIQKHSLQMTANIIEINKELKKRGVDFRIDPLSGSRQT